MADDRSAGSDLRSRGDRMFQSRSQANAEQKKTDSDVPRPPWEADMRPRSRPKSGPPTQETTVTPKWGAPYTPKKTSEPSVPKWGTPYGSKKTSSQEGASGRSTNQTESSVPKYGPYTSRRTSAPVTMRSEEPAVETEPSRRYGHERRTSAPSEDPSPVVVPTEASFTWVSSEPVSSSFEPSAVVSTEEPEAEGSEDVVEATFTLGAMSSPFEKGPEPVQIRDHTSNKDEPIIESVPVQAPQPKQPVPAPQPKQPVPSPQPKQPVAAQKPKPEKPPVKTEEKQIPEVDSLTLRQWQQEAANGSEEHQFKLGKHFLSLADASVDREKNAGLALDWLIRASKQGSEEATELLKSCVDRGLPGVEERDSEDIKWCLKTSSYEKKIRQAARGLFHKINTSHKDVLSREEYMNAVKGLTGKVREQKLLMAAGKKIGDNISENEFVKMLSRKIQGTVTLTTQELADTNVSYESAGYVTKVVRYPRQTAAAVVDQVLEYSSKEGLNWVVSLIPTNQLYVLGLLFVYSFITPDFIFFFAPLFIFYLSFAAVIICTLQMFYKRKKQKDAATLAGVLQELDVNIDLDKTESQYTWNSLTPYIVYFSNLPLVVCSFSLANKSYIPCAEVTIIAMMMTGLCFFSLSDHHDKLTFFALSANFLASLPVLLHNFPAVPFLKEAISLITDPFVVLDTGVGITFNISIPSIAYAIIPLFFIRMAMRNSWEGTYRVLVPHMVCYFWFHITTTTFPFTTWFGLARATIGYILLPIVLPISFVGIFAMIGFAVYKAFQTEMLGKVVVTSILLVVPIFMTQTKKIFGKGFDAKFGVAKKIIMVLFALLALVPLIFVKIPSWKKEVPAELSYENYTALCFREKIVNDVPQQITCSHLIGTKVKWTGTVESIGVSKIENTAESVLSSLPLVIAKPLYCMYGQEYPQCDPKLLSKKGYAFCTVMRRLGHTCHVKNHNAYDFEILVLTGSQNIKVHASDNFKETVLALEIGDTIEYKGTLVDNLGGTVPSLKLSKLAATNRELPIKVAVDDDDQKYLTAVYEAIALTFNFVWFPLLEFSSS